MAPNLETSDSAGNGLASLLVWTTSKEQRDTVASWNARVVASVANVEKHRQCSSTSGGD